jgi:hypothetical protein
MGRFNCTLSHTECYSTICNNVLNHSTRVIVFKATSNNISVISWQSVLLVEEIRVPGENHRPVANHWQIMSPPTFVGRHAYCFCPVRLSVTQFVSATPLKLLNRFSWKLVDSKDTICSCAYYQEILIVWILWELCPLELRNFPKFTTEAACQRNSSETTKQIFMKLDR